jgi:hypothetical protein
VAGASSRSAERARRLVVVALPISSIVVFAIVAGAWLGRRTCSPVRVSRRLDSSWSPSPSDSTKSLRCEPPAQRATLVWTTAGT